jgi:hypothetical protein
MKKRIVFLSFAVLCASPALADDWTPKVYSYKNPEVSGIHWASSAGGKKMGDQPTAPPPSSTWWIPRPSFASPRPSGTWNSPSRSRASP